jgi:hypothetical protein
MVAASPPIRLSAPRREGGTLRGKTRALNGEGWRDSEGSDVEVLQGKIPLSPGLDAAGKRPDSGDSVPFEEERHTGACGFVEKILRPVQKE